LLRGYFPELMVRVVNVVDLMKLHPASEHPHGLPDQGFDALFTRDRPIIFAFHGYPWLIHRLTYRRTNHDKLHVRGYKKEGTITTPFDVTVLNDTGVAWRLTTVTAGFGGGAGVVCLAQPLPSTLNAPSRRLWRKRLSVVRTISRELLKNSMMGAVAGDSRSVARPALGPCAGVESLNGAHKV
jgi:hypothetical protein